MSECVISIIGETNAFPFSDTYCRIDSPVLLPDWIFFWSTALPHGQLLTSVSVRGDGMNIHLLLFKERNKNNQPSLLQQTDEQNPQIKCFGFYLVWLVLGKVIRNCLSYERMSISLQCFRSCYEAVGSMEMMWAVISVNINRIKKELLWLETEVP